MMTSAHRHLTGRLLRTGLICLLISLASTIFAQNVSTVQARPLTAAPSAPILVIPAESEAPGLRFVTGDNAAIASDVVRVLCYADEQATAFLFETQLTTDINGYPVQDLPADCLWLVALHKQYEQPSGKTGHGPAYTVYATSWRTGSGTPDYDSPGCSYGVLNCAVARASDGDVIIRDDWPLILFNVVASLEWEPEKGSEFVKQLRTGLKYASLYLADLTDGYMAFGSIAIYTGGQRWDGADLRFQTANDLRPAAFIGGIVDSYSLFTAPVTQQSAIMRPAATFYGRYWDGDNAYTGAWYLPDAYRTMIHEWAHYALFLYDEYGSQYPRVGSSPAYCTCNDLPKLLDDTVSEVCDKVTRENGASAMAFHYVASELWHPSHGAPPMCMNSDQGLFHGESDWLTLSAWFKAQNIQGSPDLPDITVPQEPIPGPPALQENGPIADLFGYKNNAKVLLPFLKLPTKFNLPPVFTARMHVQLSDSTSPTETLAAQIYLSQNDTDNATQHILHQGTLTNPPKPPDIGSIDLWGITPDDTAQVFVDRYETASIQGARFVYYSEELSSGQAEPTVTAQENTWGSTLDLLYLTTTPSGEKPGLLTGMVALLTGPHNLDFTVAPIAKLCVPDAKIGCPPEWTKTMQLNSANVWVADFEPLPGYDELPLYGTVQIISVKDRRDGLIRWFRDAGGVGPGHKIGNAAPMRDGLVMVDNVEDPEIEAKCNRVMIMPAADYSAILTQLHVEALVTMPLDIDILFGDDFNGQCVSGFKNNLEDFKPLRLTLFYNEQAVDRLGVADETKQLSILQYRPSTESWTPIDSTIDPDLNRISATIFSDGIYAIGWMP